MSEKIKNIDKTFFSAVGIILVLIILILVNVIFSRVNWRWDATGDKLYSLSEGTRTILSGLKEDVVIKVFYSKDPVNMPVHIKNYSRRMLDFLSEYEYYGRGKISIEVYNPKVDSEEEEWAQKYGIEGVSLATGETVYFGLVATAADQEETIKFMDPTREKHLEYDITRIISQVQSPRKKKVGIISGLPVFGVPPRSMNIPGARQRMTPWVFVRELKKTYDLAEIPAASDEIGKDIDLLVIVHPKNLNPNLRYAIDQYVLGGGNVILFADPVSVTDIGTGQPNTFSLDNLFNAWGVQMNSSKVLADLDYSTRLMTRNNRVENNPLWLSLPPGAFNPDNMITAQLETLLLPVAGSIQKAPESRFEYESLLQSSLNASMVDGFMARLGAGELRYNFQPSEKAFDLAVLVRGTFDTAFPGGRPQNENQDSKDNQRDTSGTLDISDAEHLTTGQKEAKIIIMADADMLFDQYFVENQNFLGFNISRIFNDNLNFCLNAVEMLAGSPELINIRSRGKFERPFTRVQELEKKAQTRWLATEQQLVRKVEETNRKLKELEKQKDPSQTYIISAKQEAEIEQFKQEKIRVNKELKKVRRNLRSDIETLGTAVKFINIFFMPLLVSLAGIFYAIYHRTRRRQYHNKINHEDTK
jgi:ABC-type uncharacterized transport system involved in gliding motility auxiliary subunit